MKRGVFLFFALGSAWAAIAQQTPTGLLVNLLTRPELSVVTTPAPQFGWIVPTEGTDGMQSAYRIGVASSREALDANRFDFWDSGRQTSNASQHILYKGSPLSPNSTYYWKVTTWDGSGKESGFSEPQAFHTGQFGRTPAWPGESRWVRLGSGDGERWTFEDRTPIAYHTLYPVKMLRKPDGAWFVDFGRASFAYAKLLVDWQPTGGETSREAAVRIGERAENDAIDRTPGGGVQFHEYTLTIRPGLHEYDLEIPRFVSRYPHSQPMPEHMAEVIPFRYLELDPGGADAQLASIRQLALHTLFDDNASRFSSSCPLLNDVYDLCRYSVKVNAFNGDYASSQRERMMYEADTYIHQMAHYATDREFSVARYSFLNMMFHATWPTEWILHAPIMAWADYMHTGNADALRAMYEELKPKTLNALKEENELISTRTGKVTPELHDAIHLGRKVKLRDIVDWPHKGLSDIEGGETDRYDFRDYNAVVNAFHYNALALMARIAEAVGEKKDAAAYARQAAQVKKAFNEHFFDPARGIYVDGIGSAHASLHANMFPLVFGLVTDAAKPAVLDHIKSKRMACSVYGSNYLLEGMFDAGEADYAVSLMTDTTDRSWYNMIRVGSTMTTEAWDNKYKKNNGWSHAWSTAPAHILPRKLMGIEPVKPGFETLRVKPQPGPVAEACVKLPTIRGTVEASYTNAPERFVLDVTIPGNTTAEVMLPARNGVREVLWNGQAVKFGKPTDGYVTVAKPAGPGKHRFEAAY